MKLTFIGTGGLPTVGKRLPTSVVIEADRKLFLLDCGSGSLAKMADLNINFLKLYGIFMTHAHIDHLNDIISIVGSMIITGRNYPKKIRKEKLFIRGSKESLKIYKVLRKLVPIQDSFPINLKTVQKEEKFGDVIIKSIPVDHFAQMGTSCYALRLEMGNKSIVYSGDIDWSEKIPQFTEFCKDVDVLVIDAGRCIGKKGPHLEPFQVSQIAQKANPKRVVAVHLTDVDTPAAVHDGIAEFYKGDILIAKDGMELEV